MIKLVAFDLWQTLAYRDVGYHASAKMLEETKVNIPKEKFVKIFEESLQTKKWKSKISAYTHFCRNIGLRPREENVSLLMDIRDKAEAKTKLYPYTIPLLKQLKNLGYKTALVSNSSVFAVKQVKKKTKILRFIDYPIFSFEVGVIKPDLRIYKRLLAISGCEPGEVIMVGEKINDDVIPAKQIGIKAILFKTIEQLKKDFEVFGVVVNALEKFTLNQ